MKMFFTALIVLMSTNLFASEKTLCSERGLIVGNFDIDVTGYEAIVSGEIKTLELKLLAINKNVVYRTYPVTCSSPDFKNPNALMLCRSKMTDKEVLLHTYEGKLMAEVSDRQGRFINIKCE